MASQNYFNAALTSCDLERLHYCNCNIYIDTKSESVNKSVSKQVS